MLSVLFFLNQNKINSPKTMIVDCGYAAPGNKTGMVVNISDYLQKDNQTIWNTS